MTGAALAARGAASRPITLTGMDPDIYFRIVRIPDYIVFGHPRVLTDDILIGTELAKDMGVGLGEKINVSAATGSSRALTITDFFDLGNKGANQRSAFVALRTAQALLNLVGGVTTIDLTVNDIYAADTIAHAVQIATGIEADSWITTNAQFFIAVNAQQTSNTLIRVFVGLSVAFGIASVLVVSVIQRSKDIGILRAMGHRKARSCAFSCFRAACWASSARSWARPRAELPSCSGTAISAKQTAANCSLWFLRPRCSSIPSCSPR